MKVWWNGGARGIEFPGLSKLALSSLRLLQHHAPQVRIEVTVDGIPVAVAVSDLDLSHEMVRGLNTPVPESSGINAVDPGLVARVAANQRH